MVCIKVAMRCRKLTSNMGQIDKYTQREITLLTQLKHHDVYQISNIL